MPGQTEMPRGRLARRLIIVLRDPGRDRGGGRGIRRQQGRQREGPAVDRRRLHRGRRRARASDRCPSRPAASRCRRPRRRRSRRPGPRSTSSSPGSSSTSPTTRTRSAASSGSTRKTLPGGGHRLTGTVDCVSGGRSLSSTRSRPRAPRRRSSEPSAGSRSPPRSRPPRPPPGAAAPRTPTNIQGTYALSPGSTCFGSSFSIHGTGSVAQLYSSRGKLLGPVTYSTKTAGVFGDVKCVKGGDGPPDRDRQRPPAPERHGDPAQRGHAGRRRRPRRPSRR